MRPSHRFRVLALIIVRAIRVSFRWLTCEMVVRSAWYAVSPAGVQCSQLNCARGGI